MNKATYFNDGKFFYKVEENKVTTVCTHDFALRVEIMIGNEDYIKHAQLYDVINEHEFNHAVAQVLQVLNEKIFNK